MVLPYDVKPLRCLKTPGDQVFLSRKRETPFFVSFQSQTPERQNIENKTAFGIIPKAIPDDSAQYGVVISIAVQDRRAGIEHVKVGIRESCDHGKRKIHQPRIASRVWIWHDIHRQRFPVHLYFDRILWLMSLKHLKNRVGKLVEDCRPEQHFMLTEGYGRASLRDFYLLLKVQGVIHTYNWCVLVWYDPRT